MKTYILNDMLEDFGVTFKKHWTRHEEPRSLFRDILMVEDGLFRAIAPGDPNFRRISKKISRNIPLEPWELKEVPYIHLSEIKKVVYRPKFEMAIAFGVGDGYMYDTGVKLFRAIHADTKPKLSLNSLWLINPEISKIIAPYVTAPGVMTDFKQVGDFLAPRSENVRRSGQNRLGLVYTSFEWSKGEEKWVYTK